MFAQTHDIGAYLAGFNGLNPEQISSSAAGSERNGFDVNRLSTAAFGTKVYRSVKVIIPYSASLAATETATLVSNVQDGTSTAAYADYADKDGSTGNTLVIGSTASTAAQTINGVFEYDVDLGGAEQYFRVQVTPTFTAATTDTLDIGCTLVFGGPEKHQA
jgi:hypothetical protein